MNEPDYKNYSLSELHEALNSLDKTLYKFKADLIRDEIRKRDVKKVPVQSIGIKDYNLKVKKYLRIVTLLFLKYSIILYAFSFLFGSSLLSAAIFGNSLLFSELGYSFYFYFIGILQIEESIRQVIVIVFGFLPVMGLIISPLLHLFKRNIANIILCLSWCMLCIGIKLVIFGWWPTSTFDYEFGFDFSINNYDLGLKINIIATYFFIWSSILVPSFRKEILKELTENN